MASKRKLSAVLVGLATMSCLSLPVRAELKAGDHIVSFNAGASFPLNEVDFADVGGGKETAVKTGPGFSAQYLYHLTPSFAFGGEAAYAAYGDKDHMITVNTFTGPANLNVTLASKAWAVQAVARYVLVPEKMIHPYFLGGLGMGGVHSKTTTTPIPPAVWTPSGTQETRTNSEGNATGVAFSLGAGVDGYITESWLLGLDLRWIYLGTKKSFDDQVFGAGVTDELEASKAFVISGKIGYKFGR